MCLEHSQKAQMHDFIKNTAFFTEFNVGAAATKQRLVKDCQISLSFWEWSTYFVISKYVCYKHHSIWVLTAASFSLGYMQIWHKSDCDESDSPDRLKSLTPAHSLS